MGGGQGGGVVKVLGTGLIDNPLTGQAGILSPNPKNLPQPAQPIQNLKPIPTIDDAAVKAARNNQLISLQQKSGRSSTNLSSTQGTKTTFGS